MVALRACFGPSEGEERGSIGLTVKCNIRAFRSWMRGSDQFSSENGVGKVDQMLENGTQYLSACGSHRSFFERLSPATLLYEFVVNDWEIVTGKGSPSGEKTLFVFPPEKLLLITCPPLTSFPVFCRGLVGLAALGKEKEEASAEEMGKSQWMTSQYAFL